MKNPLEFSLLEVEALLRDDADGPQREFTILIGYVHDRQNYLKAYAVQRAAEEIKAQKAGVELPRRKARSMDKDLLDEAEIVILDSQSEAEAV